MPLQPLDDELVRDAPRRDAPEATSRRVTHVRSEVEVLRDDARGCKREDAREDSRKR